MLKISRKSRKGFMVGIWAAVACLMLYRACPFLLASQDSEPVWMWPAIGLLFGGAKGWFVLSRSATRNGAYIDRRPEQDWFWLSLHPILYVLVPMMVGFARLVRYWLDGSLPGLIGAMYLAVAVALLLGTRGIRRTAQ